MRSWDGQNTEASSYLSDQEELDKYYEEYTLKKLSVKDGSDNFDYLKELIESGGWAEGKYLAVFTVLTKIGEEEPEKLAGI